MAATGMANYKSDGFSFLYSLIFPLLIASQVPACLNYAKMN